MFDVRSFVEGDRVVGSFRGHEHNFERVSFSFQLVHFRSQFLMSSHSLKTAVHSSNHLCVCLQNLLKCGWSPDGQWVTAGSSDRFVYVWEVDSGRIAYKLPGHQGSVVATDFSPIEPIREWFSDSE